MNKEGHIRELGPDECPDQGEVSLTHEEATSLSQCGTKARKDYYRAIKQGLSPEAALACALGTQRATGGK
jgi:hypothetical protein